MKAYKPAPILIIHQGALGDLLLSLPALYALRMFHKKNPWTLAGNPETLSLLQGRFYGKTIFPGHHRDWTGLYQTKVRVSDPFRHFLTSFEKAYLFSKGRPDPLIHGLEQGGVEKVLWIPSFPDEQRRIPLQTLQKNILQSHSIPWAASGKTLFLTRKDLQEARSRLAAIKKPGRKKPLWAIHPGSGSQHKNWPLKRFIELAREIEKHQQLQPIFLLGPVEQAVWADPAGVVREMEFPLINTPPLPILAGLLSQCAGYLGNDSGVSHLAAALGLTTVVLFGPTDPFLWGPKGEAVHILSASRDCSPCSEASRRSCPDKACLTDLTVEQVLETMMDISSKKPVVTKIKVRGSRLKV